MKTPEVAQRVLDDTAASMQASGELSADIQSARGSRDLADRFAFYGGFSKPQKGRQRALFAGLDSRRQSGASASLTFNEASDLREIVKMMHAGAPTTGKICKVFSWATIGMGVVACVNPTSWWSDAIAPPASAWPA